MMLLVIITITATVYLIVTPHVGEKFTEYYVLGPVRKADNYTTEISMERKPRY